VLEEVMEIFPSPYIHIGGDECSTVEWEASERAAELCRERGLTGPRALQGWFTSQMAEAVAAKGRSLVCWEEVLDAGAPPGCLISPWRATSALSVAKRAAASGHRVVMAPEPWVYFDWSYADNPAEPLAIRPSISVEKVYSLEPVPTGLERELEEMIVGAQCQLWTEYVATREHAEYMFFPRACALAEAVWSDGNRSWAEFEPRLAAHLARLDALGVNYRPLAGPTPGQARVWPS
jgi:hexosaminidase